MKKKMILSFLALMFTGFFAASSAQSLGQHGHALVRYNNYRNNHHMATSVNYKMPEKPKAYNTYRNISMGYSNNPLYRSGSISNKRNSRRGNFSMLISI